MNICSNERGLGGMLTNPTEMAFRKGNIGRHYPVMFLGGKYVDAEAAYHACKRFPHDLEVMAEIIKHKLQQYPELLAAIHNNGGQDWLMQCTHYTGARTPRYQWWEGAGTGSPFICALLDGYMQACAGATK